MSNALKFTPSGGSVDVLTEFVPEFDSIVITVRDTGIGVRPEDIATAMMPFGQIEASLDRRYEGTGLGLPLARSFAEKLGGTLGIESEVGSRTTVTVTLPVSMSGDA